MLEIVAHLAEAVLKKVNLRHMSLQTKATQALITEERELKKINFFLFIYVNWQSTFSKFKAKYNVKKLKINCYRNCCTVILVISKFIMKNEFPNENEE